MRLRGHNLLCIQGFVGKGYSPEFVANMTRVVDSLGRNARIEVVAEPDDLSAKTGEIANRLASGPSIAFRYMKENINRAISSGDLGDCMDLEATHHIHCGQTEDHRNATKAFVEKREPVFTGR